MPTFWPLCYLDCDQKPSAMWNFEEYLFKPSLLVYLTDFSASRFLTFIIILALAVAGVSKSSWSNNPLAYNPASHVLALPLEIDFVACFLKFFCPLNLDQAIWFRNTSTSTTPWLHLDHFLMKRRHVWCPLVIQATPAEVAIYVITVLGKSQAGDQLSRPAGSKHSGSGWMFGRKMEKGFEVGHPVATRCI